VLSLVLNVLAYLYFVFCVQEMKLVEYMYRSQIPQMFKIIDMFHKSIELRRTLIGRQHQVVSLSIYNFCNVV